MVTRTGKRARGICFRVVSPGKRFVLLQLFWRCWSLLFSLTSSSRKPSYEQRHENRWRFCRTCCFQFQETHSYLSLMINIRVSAIRPKKILDGIGFNELCIWETIFLKSLSWVVFTIEKCFYKNPIWRNESIATNKEQHLSKIWAQPEKEVKQKLVHNYEDHVKSVQLLITRF